MNNANADHRDAAVECTQHSALRAEVEFAAYCLFKQQGSRHGNHVAHWLEAEQRVRAAHATVKHPHPLGDIL